MTEENFKKTRPTEQSFGRGIEGLKNIRMTHAEKARILERVFATPIKSPYMRRVPVFAFVYSHHARIVFASCLVLALSLGGATYVSGESLPGDLFYPIKTKFVEPMLDVVNRAPEKKIVWEEQKVTRRIEEAEKLLEKDELDDERLEALERSIEKSSTAFAKAANVVASSTATSSSSAREKTKSLKQEFRKKISERKEVFDREEREDKEKEEKQKEAEKVERESRREKIRRLEDTAVKFADDDDEDREEDDD